MIFQSNLPVSAMTGTLPSINQTRMKQFDFRQCSLENILKLLILQREYICEKFQRPRCKIFQFFFFLKSFLGFRIQANQVISYRLHPTYEDHFLKKYFLKIYRGPNAKIFQYFEKMAGYKAIQLAVQTLRQEQ